MEASRLDGMKAEELVRPVQTLPAELFGSSHRFDLQQSNVLLSLLQRCLVDGDYNSAATICSTLISSQDACKLTSQPVSARKQTPQQANLSFVLSAATEILLRASLPHEKVAAQVQKISRSQPTYLGVEKTSFDLAAILLDQGEVQKAFDVLSNKPSMRLGKGTLLTPKTVQHFHRAAYCALIKYHQWLKVLNEVKAEWAVWLVEQSDSKNKQKGNDDDGGEDDEANRDEDVDEGEVGLEEGSGGEEGRVDGGGAGGSGAAFRFDPCSMMGIFFYDFKFWLRAKSHRSLKGLSRESLSLLKEAVSLRPSATMLSYLLCHSYVVAGNFKKALAAARSATQAAPSDPDALALEVMMRQVSVNYLRDVEEDGDAAAGSSRSRGRKQQRQQEEEEMSQPEEGGEGGAEDHAGGESGSDGSLVHRTGALQLRALQADPACGAALGGLIKDSSHCPRCQMLAVQGCLLFLDVSTVIGGCCTSSAAVQETAAWEALSGCLMFLAQDFLAAGASVLSDAPPDTRHELWKQLVGEELPDRAYWWPHAHLAPHALDLEDFDLLSAVPVAAGVLTSKAVVACFMLGGASVVATQTRSLLEASLQALGRAELEDPLGHAGQENVAMLQVKHEEPGPSNLVRGGGHRPSASSSPDSLSSQPSPSSSSPSFQAGGGPSPGAGRGLVDRARSPPSASPQGGHFLESRRLVERCLKCLVVAQQKAWDASVLLHKLQYRPPAARHPLPSAEQRQRQGRRRGEQQEEQEQEQEQEPVHQERAEQEQQQRQEEEQEQFWGPGVAHLRPPIPRHSTAELSTSWWMVFPMKKRRRVEPVEHIVHEGEADGEGEQVDLMI